MHFYDDLISRFAYHYQTSQIGRFDRREFIGAYAVIFRGLMPDRRHGGGLISAPSALELLSRG